MKRLSLYFVAPRKISICEDQIPELSDRQVLVQSIVSLISHGTEMLVYRNQFPKDIPVDSTITYLHNNF
ncbi:MAG: hypothetical protein ACFFDT_31310, partial [Candidatus Hodarchaeota archaeon]